MRENLWQAARFGWDGLPWDVETLKPRLLRDCTRQWIERMMASAEQLGEDVGLRERIGLLDQDSQADESAWVVCNSRPWRALQR
jgi:gamma-glutamyl:cysteine ligase YbdK (ATP-grasp superfamily)